MRSHRPGVIRLPRGPVPAAGSGMASQNPFFERINAPWSCAATTTGARLYTSPADPKLGRPFGYTSPRQVLARREPKTEPSICERNSLLSPCVASRTPVVTATRAEFNSCAIILERSPCRAASIRTLMLTSPSLDSQARGRHSPSRSSDHGRSAHRLE